MKTLNCFVAFVVVLVVLGSVAVADGQTTAERNAYASMDRAVQSAQANPTADRITAAQRAIRSAYNVFLGQERNRDQAAVQAHNAQQAANAAIDTSQWQQWRTHERRATRLYMRYAELLGLSTAPLRTWSNVIPRVRDNGSHQRIQADIDAINAYMARLSPTHARYLHAAMDSIRDAAEAIGRLDPSILGTRHNDMMLRFENANMAAINQLRVTLRARNGNWEGWDESAFDTALSTLVDSVSTVANTMANRQREDVSNQQAFIEAERRQEQERQQAQIQEQQRQQERAEQLRTGAVSTLQEFNDALASAMWEARQAARGVASASFYEDAHPHHERGDAAVARARSLINGRAGYVPTGNYGQYEQILRDLSRTLGECPSKPRR